MESIGGEPVRIRLQAARKRPVFILLLYLSITDYLGNRLHARFVSLTIKGIHGAGI
jgi:hypothetical protein